MGKPWALFFAVNMLAMAGLCFAAPALGWWMPEGVSTHAASVDFLFNVILWITAFFFFLTEALLVAFIWKYGSGARQAGAPTMPAFLKPIGGLIDNPHKIELAWTIVPAAILLYIAFAQVGTWANVKYQSRRANLVGDKTAIQIEVSARQFEWRMRYPSVERVREWLKNRDAAKRDMDSFGKYPQADDVHAVNELHVWKDNPVMVHLGTRDVLHSFNLPHFRVKQDSLPGKVIPVWFTPTRSNVARGKGPAGDIVWLDGGGRESDGQPVDKSRVWDIACAELCGWGHWRMIGRVFVHDTAEDFLAWLEQSGKSEHGKTAAK